MNNAPPMYWLKQLKNGIEESKSIPLWGYPPSFPWKNLETSLRKLLEVEDFTLSLLPLKETEEDLLFSFGKDPKKIFFQLSPLKETLVLVLAKESMRKISALLLQKGSLDKEFTEDFEEGYYQFLLLQICKQIETLNIYPSLHIQWVGEKEINKSSFFIDIKITLYKRDFTARILFPKEFQHSFSAHFAKKEIDLTNSPLMDSLAISAALQIGNCALTKKEWQSLETGDCLILDRCSFNPETSKGTAVLTWNDRPFFQVKLKKNQIKILDYSVYQGEQKPMLDQFSDEAFNEEGEDLQTDIESLESLEEEELSPPQDQEQTPPESNPFPTEEKKELFRLEEVPFSITVEVDRIQISLEKLLALQPGNTLELETRPEQGVLLTVQGKPIAKGELVKIGDLLGVKITELKK